jgi:hypothetical protein
MTRLALAGRAAGTLRPCTGTAGEPGDAPAGAEAAIQAAANQEEAAVLAGACAACGGRCCRAGGDVAYLTADTVGDFVDAHPGLDGRRVAAAYLAHVPELTVPGSCVYHGAVGCGLPREMRSVVCNRFLCDGLVELRALVRRRDEAPPGPARRDPGAPAPAAYLAVVTDGRVGRGALTLASGDPIA